MLTLNTTRRRKGANNWPLYFLSMAALVAVEAFSAFGILTINKAQLSLFGVSFALGYVEIAITLFASLLSFWVATAGARMANDPRPEQKKRAGAAIMLSLAILYVGPAPYFAKGFAVPRQEAAHAEYVGSAAMEADQAIIADPQADSQVKLAAAASLKQAQKPTTAQPTFWEYVKAFAIHTALWLCGFVALLAPPETDAQRRDRIEAAEKARRKAERDARKAQKAKEARKGNVFDLQRWVANGKQDAA